MHLGQTQSSQNEVKQGSNPKNMRFWRFFVRFFILMNSKSKINLYII